MHCRISWRPGYFVFYTLRLHKDPDKEVKWCQAGRSVAPNVSAQLCLPTCSDKCYWGSDVRLLSSECKTLALGMSSWLLKRRIEAHGLCSAACWMRPMFSSEVCSLPERFSSSTLPVPLNLLSRSWLLALVGAGFPNCRSKLCCTYC
jgi:hypothetical protein